MTVHVRFIKNKDGSIEACFMRQSGEVRWNGKHLERKCYPSGWCHENKIRGKRAKAEECVDIINELIKLGYTDIKIV